MGCNVQVHKKVAPSTPGLSTWLTDAPKHYQTHKCHIKHTNSECFSNTVKFQHKRITNPSISPADKIMRAILSCIHAICGLPDSKSNNNLQQLHSILHDTTINQQQFNKILQQWSELQQPPASRVPAPLPRVDNIVSDN
ncbi:hypothetical protein ACHAW6_014730 [Cyclotella cf. meneghiniana]